MSMHAAAVCGCFCWRSAGNTVPADAAALPARVAEHFRQERPATCLFVLLDAAGQKTPCADRRPREQLPRRLCIVRRKAARQGSLCF